MASLIITDANSTLLRSGNWLLAIHGVGTYWQCPHSVDLLRRWDMEIASVLKSNSSLQFHNNSVYNIALIDGCENTRIAALLEVQAYPTVKLIQQGLVWTYRESLNFTSESIVEFAADGWKQHMWYNKLPPTWSVWFKLQLDLFNFACAAIVYIENAIGSLSTSPSTSNLLTFLVFVLVSVGAGVLLPFGIIYLL
ncbi:hypothetical protein BDR26DRAFT_422634 [Obelidium mucronatum]|nr:hypothetical protein BDR26DRAFT_422634 [Obelidium mucronatum]